MELTIHQAMLDTTLECVNIGISGGKITKITSGDIPRGDQSIDANGAMVSPALIEPHFHLENAFLWNTENLNQSGTLREAIAMYANIKAHMTKDDMVERASRTINEAITNGVLWMRNHVDIDQIAKLDLLKNICVVREKFKDVFDLQIIAFPQHGLARNPEAVDYMWQAMENGAQVIGGIPHHEKNMEDGARHIEIAFEIAKKHNANIDMHIDETDDPYWHSMELLAEKTIEEGYQGRVTASHCCAMAGWDNKMAARIITKVKKAEMSVISNTPINLLLQGRGDEPPVRRGIARIAEMLEAGVNVCCGQDDIMNMFYPFGQMDPLEVASFACHAGHLAAPDQIETAFNMPRYHAAKNLGLKNYGVYEGADANLILLDAKSAVDALRRKPKRSFVIQNGDILIQNELKTVVSHKIPK